MYHEEIQIEGLQSCIPKGQEQVQNRVVTGETEDRTLRYITTFNDQWSKLRNILYRNWNILTNDTRVLKHIPTKPLLILRIDFPTVTLNGQW